MPLALRLPSSLGPARPTPPEVVRLCESLDVRLLSLDGNLVECWLGRPEPIVPLEPPGEDGVSAGLLEIEEEVFRDAYELARRTFDAALEAWRREVSLTCLAEAHRLFDAAGIEVLSVDWRRVALRSDADFQHARRSSRELGSHTLAVACAYDAIRRPVGADDDLRRVFAGTTATTPGEYRDALAHDPRHWIAVDVTAPGAERVVDALLDTGRVAYLETCLEDVRTWAEVKSRLAWAQERTGVPVVVEVV